MRAVLSVLRHRSTTVRSAATATALLLAASMGACERDGKEAKPAEPPRDVSPQTKKLEDNIRSGIESRYGARVKSTHCPEALTPAVGTDIKCQVHVASTELPLEITVAWTSDAGAFQWRDRGVVRMDKLHALVAQKLEADGKTGSAHCKGPIRVSQPGSAFDCPIKYKDGKPGSVSVRVRTWQGDVDLDFN